jgi:hypothetical protein
VSDDLRTQITTALSPMTHGGTVNALLSDILDALTPIVDGAILEAQRPPGSCPECWGDTEDNGHKHHRTCSRYNGPIVHRQAILRYDAATSIAHLACACGTRWTAVRESHPILDRDWDCPNAAETWRGPRAGEEEEHHG